MPGPGKFTELGKETPRFFQSEFDIEHIFTYHAPPSPEEIDSYVALRSAAYEFAKVVVKETPQCADRSAAIRLIREAVMTANAAIALGGRLHEETTSPE